MRPSVLTEKQASIFVITLNRPAQFNALNNELQGLLREKLLEFKEDSSLQVAILKGAGGNFCSGADIKQFGEQEAATPLAIRQRANLSMEVHGLFSKIEKPIISSIEGYALAGGCGLALAADFVLAADNAVFGYPEIKRGFVPALVLVNLSKLVGRRKALELIMTGRKMKAEEALAWGLVNEVVPQAKLAERTGEFAAELAKLSQQALSYTKSLFYQVVELDLQKGLQCGREVNALMRQAQDFVQGVDAFTTKKRGAAYETTNRN